MNPTMFAALMACVSGCAVAQELEFTVLYDGAPTEPALSVFDSSGTLISQLPTVPLTGYRVGLDYAPDGQLWIMGSFVDARFGTIDPQTGVFHEVGNHADDLGTVPFGGGGITVSPDGSRVHVNSGLQNVGGANGNNDAFGTIFTYSTDGVLLGTVTYGAPLGAVSESIAVLDDGSFLLSDLINGGLWRVDAVTGEQTPLSLDTDASIADFARVGDRLFAMTTDAKIYEIDLETMTTDVVFEQLGTQINAFGLAVRVVPTPATLALLAPVGLLASRRRR